MIKKAEFEMRSWLSNLKYWILGVGLKKYPIHSEAKIALDINIIIDILPLDILSSDTLIENIFESSICISER